ncbi:MAG: winged helix-turn-helix transcriptional regulator [Lachnospiraceae bacterium]|nr:winged helix-turn-helix transcriptional regulator [Lachnospiraceae bacterium]
MRRPEDILMLLGHSDSEVTTQNDYLAATCIIRRIVKDESLSIEEVAEETNISSASVSRFIRKMGFDNWQGFRESCSGCAKEMQYRRLMNIENPAWSVDELVENMFNRIIDNLNSTKETFDKELIEKFLSLMETADQVIFLGDEHSLSCFFTLQLDLIFRGIPAYLFKNQDVQDMEIDRCNENTLVVFFNVENNFLYSQRREQLANAKKRGAKVFVFSQQPIDDVIECDYVYRYGLPGSVNNGYYSLFFLSQIISEMLIKRGV